MLALDILPSAESAQPEKLKNHLVVIVDVIRASAVITTALANGSPAVVPCLTIEETLEKAKACAPGSYLLGGERQGIKIPGFDLGNSPFEYQAKTVKDKIILFTTTNGTKAIRRSSLARRVIIGSFVNISAVTAELCQALTGDAPSYEGITILCAGTNDRFSMDDFCCAGRIVDLVSKASLPAEKKPRLTDIAIAARELYRAYHGRLLDLLRDTAVYRTVLALEIEDDLHYCLQEDIFAIVPYQSGEKIIRQRGAQLP